MAIVAAVLLATIDDRHVGKAADERQLTWTAVALAETGQWEQARDRDFNYVRGDGSAVSRFGMGMTLLQVPAALLAPAVERAWGPGASQPLFLVAPLILVLVSAAAAGIACRQLGGESAPAIVLAALGSPLGAYAATGFSEPLQAAALVTAFAAALTSAASPARGRAVRLALLAGAMAGVGLLAKSALVVVAPLALLPVLSRTPDDLRAQRIRGALAGFLPLAVAWGSVEWARFGKLFGSYPGESFNHPIWDGCWRLLVGPNLGLVLFFPALLLVVWLVAMALVRREWALLARVSGAVLPFVVLLGLAASWWAWHGVWGWGPRLMVPAVPALAAVAAAAMATWPAWLRRSLIAASIAINIPGLVQHQTPIAAYISNLVWPTAPAAVAQSLAGYATRLEPDGTYRVSPDHVLATIPQASQFVIYPWFFLANWSNDAGEAGRALASPPWKGVRPDLVPTEIPMSEAYLRQITGHPRWRFWGRGFSPSTDDALYASVFDEGLADQVIRLQQRGRGAESLALAERLVALAPFGQYDALVLESYRLMGNRPAAGEYLARMPVDRRMYPAINVVLALFERGAGNETLARQFLGSVADRFPPAAPLQAALVAPLNAWPSGLQAMIGVPVRTAGQ